MTAEALFKINDAHFNLINYGYKEYLTPKTGLPIYQIGLLAKVNVFSERFQMQVDLPVSFWTTLGPETSMPTFQKVAIPSFKFIKKKNGFDKKFPNKDIERVSGLCGIDIGEYFSAYHSSLIITEWYSEQTRKIS